MDLNSQLWDLSCKFCNTLSEYSSAWRRGQCRIKGSAPGAAAPGTAVFGARKWWEWKSFMYCEGSAFGAAPGPAL